MKDSIIIGAGPAGYLAAERLAHNGKSVLLIEKDAIGGTCLNVGCIPTKALIHSAKQYMHEKEASQFGIYTQNPSYNLSEMMAWKEKTIKTLNGGVSSKLKKLGVEIIKGTGIVISQNQVKIQETGDIFEAKTILIATGSIPIIPNIEGAKNNPRVMDSTDLLSINYVPENLCIIGGGVIGVEFASLFNMLDSKVTVIEMQDEIIPPMDKEHAPLLRKALTNVDFKLGCKVEKIEQGTNSDTVIFSTKDGTQESVVADTILICIGRKADFSNSISDELKLATESKGITVDSKMRTNIDGIWAAGDVNGMNMLAHSAYKMADVATEDMCNYLDSKQESTSAKMEYNAIPWIVYGSTEVAGCGLTEQEASAQNIDIVCANIPLLMSGRFIAEHGLKAPGAVKVIAEKSSRTIVGIHIVGSYASEIIWGASTIIAQKLTIEDVKKQIFPHPTVSEVIREAVWAL